MSAENHIDPRGLCHNRVSILLGKAATDGNLESRVFLLLLKKNAQVAVKLVVGVLSNSTGVEYNHV